MAYKEFAPWVKQMKYARASPLAAFGELEGHVGKVQILLEIITAQPCNLVTQQRRWCRASV